MPDLVQRLKFQLTPWIFRGLTASVRVERRQAPQPGPATIFASLHRDMIPAIIGVAPYRPVLLVSRSDDGEILIRTLASRGYGFVRGSTGKEGGAAFRSLLSQLAAGRSIGIAVDGPRGPFGTIHDGVLRLARLSGATIVPVVATPGVHLSLKTWDRTIVPAPGSRLAITFGERITVGEGEAGRHGAELAVRRALLGDSR